MKLKVNFFSDHVKLYSTTHGLPPKMKVWVLICCFLPKLRSLLHGILDKSRIISRKHCVPQLKGIGWGCLRDGLHPGLSLIIDILKLDGFVKIYHSLTIILLLVGYPLIDCITWRLLLLDSHHLIIYVLTLNNIWNLLHQFMVVFPRNHVFYLGKLLHSEVIKTVWWT